MCETKVAKYSCGHMHRRPIRPCHIQRNEYTTHCLSSKIISRIEEWDQPCKECRELEEIRSLLEKAEIARTEWTKFTAGAIAVGESAEIERGKAELAKCEVALDRCMNKLAAAEKEMEESVSRALFAISVWEAKNNTNSEADPGTLVQPFGQQVR